jgi:20S proteasome alpha/beta subunit
VTTCAFKDGVLAADTQGDLGGLRTRVDKLFQVDETRMLAGEGKLHLIHALVEHVRANGLIRWSTHQLPDDDLPGALLVDIKARKLYRLDGPMWVEVAGGVHAVGSGRDFALGALMAGKSAEDAVRIAARLDCYSGGDVQTARCW